MANDRGTGDLGPDSELGAIVVRSVDPGPVEIAWPGLHQRVGQLGLFLRRDGLFDFGCRAGRDDAKRDEFDRNVKAHAIEPLMRVVETIKYFVDRAGFGDEFGRDVDGDLKALLLVAQIQGIADAAIALLDLLLVEPRFRLFFQAPRSAARPVSSRVPQSIG